MKTLEETTLRVIEIFKEQSEEPKALEYLIAKEIGEYASDVAKWNLEQLTKTEKPN